MTAITPEDAAYPVRPGRRRKSTDLPEIRLLSWLGLETVVWGVLLGHMVKWIGNALYFFGIQVRYSTSYGGAGGWYFDWYPKDLWDRLPVHLSNWLHLNWYPARLAATPHWAPALWQLDRHSIRDTLIALGAGFVLTLIFAKPKYPADDDVRPRHYVIAVALLGAASLLAVGLILLISWKVQWAVHHGYQVPAKYGAGASEVNSWIAAATWVATVVGGIIGLMMKRLPPVRRVADDVQWFVGQRSASKIRSDRGLNKLVTRVWGTPSHRLRVHWLLDNSPDLPERSPWIVRGLVALGGAGLVLSGLGAWLTLAGPAAVH